MGYGNCTETKGTIPPQECPGIYTKFGGCGFREDHSLNVFTSPDLVHWTFHGDAFVTRPKGIYFRPKVVYNAKVTTHHHTPHKNHTHTHDYYQLSHAVTMCPPG